MEVAAIDNGVFLHDVLSHRQGSDRSAEAIIDLFDPAALATPWRFANNLTPVCSCRIYVQAAPLEPKLVETLASSRIAPIRYALPPLRTLLKSHSTLFVISMSSL